MIQIKPRIEHQGTCPGCGQEINPFRVLWQGQHTCGVFKCPSCQTLFLEDFRMMFSIDAPFQVNLLTGDLIQLYGKTDYVGWFGRPLRQSLASPQDYPNLAIKVEKIKDHQEVVILNCLDFLYGHCLIKLLDLEYYLNQQTSLGIIIIIPDILRWLVPDSVAEIWTVNIPLGKMLNFYPELDQRINRECERFDLVYVSKGVHQPPFCNITRYTRAPQYNFEKQDFRITFIWRSDRVWSPQKVYLYHGISPEIRLYSLEQQQKNICQLFEQLRIHFPHAIFTVAGLGRETAFPCWIDDCRVEKYTEDLERSMCQIYGESHLVIGVHGSNMLLPSAHAGLTIDLLPDDRWGNLADDIIYQDIPINKIVHKYIHLPLAIDIHLLTKIAAVVIDKLCKK
ncbi:hypothetical protein [Pelosinus sp. sgz500959]|uniref:hypothetical protein n=1 Tax=Pelosinus sp. sgz500959 TaxID=3242472 RepID=UPI00366BBEA9